MNALEDVLRLIAGAEPHSWQPRVFAEQSGNTLEAVHSVLEHLYLEGLVVRGEGTAEAGPGVVLTDKGRRLLDDPEMLERLRTGQALDPHDRGSIIREMLKREPAPIVSRLLLLANILIFAYGAYIANARRILSPYLTIFLNVKPDVYRRLEPVFHEIGALKPTDVLNGEWWRLLTCCFVHIGLIHLLMNMYMLRSLGRTIEQMYDRTSYLVLYLLAGLGGSCLGVAMQPAMIDRGHLVIITAAGASGALCGLIGALGVWMLFNYRYLPRSMMHRWRGGFIGTVVLLVFISLLPGVGGWAHLGGGITGVLAGGLLYWLRFGAAPWRWLCLLSLLLLPVLDYVVIDQARQRSPLWQRLERQRFSDLNLEERLREARDAATNAYDLQFLPLLRRYQDSWSEGQKEKAEARQALTRALLQVQEIETVLNKVKQTYRDQKTTQAADHQLQHLGERQHLLEMALALLDKENLGPQDVEAVRAQERKVRRLPADKDQDQP